MGMFSPSVRGNLLDLAHIWADADSPDSAFQPIPSHLLVVWQEGLPYWSGLSEADQQAIERVTARVEQLLTRQEVRLKWLPFHKHPDLYPLADTEAQSAAAHLYPAFTLVAIPAKFRMPSPRYSHTHTQDEMKNHPPIRVRWPDPGFGGLRDFLTEAMKLEGIETWGWPMARGLLGKAPSLHQEGKNYLAIMAVATAPWFAKSAKPMNEAEAVTLTNSQLMAAQSPEIKHIGTAVAKMDFYLFAAP